MTSATQALRIARSILFTPANDARKCARVGTFGADAFVLDLEDAVANEEKIAAREGLSETLAMHARSIGCVRINPWLGPLGRDDLDAAVGPDLDAVVLPKVETAAELWEVDQVLSDREQAQGRSPGSIGLLPLLETARGVARAATILDRVPDRVPRVIFGSGDFTTEIGVDLSQDGSECLAARSWLVILSKAAGLASPVDGPYLRIHDDDGLHQDNLRSRGLGFTGRVVVYPGQVATVNRSYREPTQQERERFERIIAEFEVAEEQGVASIQVDGFFVDYPIYARAVEFMRRSRDGGT